VLAGRYRVVSRLGQGGMGEVYRAEDLRLDQTVALKFLPAALSHDPDRLRRLHDEVRRGRQVTHPNVCRVYDIVEADGETFLTMEFIDGQTLAALLRQVGRLPQERGLAIARQLCQGLAAAHEQGVIHRDLKPQNVMLDAKGQARITDFSLAAEAEDVHGSEVYHGTPAYMAPEQLAGREVSPQSDLFSLGLVLYEMFTGRHPFPTKSVRELRRLHEGGPTPQPSSHLTGLDPALKGLILRCLERDPKGRPRSAQEVLAGLPRGDPLAAALAAGETPAPEVVVNAAVEGRLPPRAALALLAVTLLMVGALAVLADRVKFFRRVPFEASPEQMVFGARQMLRRVGCGGAPADSAWGFDHDVAYQLELNRRDPSAGRWQGLSSGRPPIHYFWYRESPFLLEAGGPGSRYGAVTPSQPPLAYPGMVTLFLDPQGRLAEFHRVPGGPEDSPPASPDWGLFFEWAGLDAGQLQPAAPRWPRPLGADRQAAWEGFFPERPDVPVRVEAAAAGGRPVLFLVSTPGREEPRLLKVGGQPNQGLRTAFEVGLVLVIAVGGGALALRNLRRGRADVRGAGRLGLFVFGLTLAAWLLRAHHAPLLEVEQALFVKALGQALASAGILYLAYMAIEPYLRRRWPWRIVSWERLLAGRVRDPLVGRDLLLGTLLGAALALLHKLEVVTCEALALPADIYFARSHLEALSLARLPHFFLVAQLEYALWGGLTGWVLFFFLFLLSRREWLAGLGAVAVWTVLFLSGPDYLHPVNAAFVVFSCVLVVCFGLRFGLLPIVVSNGCWFILEFAPITYDLRAWYAGSTLASLAVVLSLAGYGFWVAKAGQPLFSAAWLEGE
jgi:serine/threonine-protein kinase